MVFKTKSYLILSLLLVFTTSCSSSNDISVPILEQQNTTNVLSNQENDINNQSVITARLIIDKMPKITNPKEQDKVVKDFEPLFKNLNRYSLWSLISYATKVTNDNLKPGQSYEDSPVTKLVVPMLEKYTFRMKKVSDGFHLLVRIISFKNQNLEEREKVIIEFEKFSESLIKSDAKELIKMLNDEEPGSVGSYITVGSKLSKRLLKALEKRI